MRKFVWVLLACSATRCLLAQGADPANGAAAPPAAAADVEELRKQVQSLTELVKSLQQQVKEQQAAIEKNNSSAPSLPENPEPQTTAASGSPTPAASAPPLFPTTDSTVVATTGSSAPAPAQSGVDANGTAFPTTDSSVVTGTDSTATTNTDTSSQSIPVIGGGRSFINLSFNGQFALAASSARDVDNIEVGDHDPQQRGFNARNAEIVLSGAVDPYFEGFANIVLKLENNNETEIELEEAFMQTTSLPFGLQLKGGQFFAAFGRQNTIHPHGWDFLDASLVNGRLLGPDGLRGVGAQISWTIPVPWYSQLLFGLQNGRGGTAYSFRNTGDDDIFYGRMTIDRDAIGVRDFVYVPRWENSFNLSSTQTVLFGVSGAFGTNDTGPATRTEIYGADLLYKWKSERANGGFPFVKWQTEAMYRRFEAGQGLDESFPVSETFHDWGMYSQVLWGFKKGWVVGVRGDYLHMTDSAFTDDLVRQSRARLSANLTWYPTEFSKIRLQYNHDMLEEMNFLAAREEDSIFLQFEFNLGAHGAHKF